MARKKTTKKTVAKKAEPVAVPVADNGETTSEYITDQPKPRPDLERKAMLERGPKPAKVEEVLFTGSGGIMVPCGLNAEGKPDKAMVSFLREDGYIYRSKNPIITEELDKRGYKRV